ncbi:hypothetical protein ABW19_dt0203163 [Dactylella cylindrospora]|nr:hypothetical protein ABW19_dt0203163 [Dactylella cylindrospora]
MSNRYRSFKRVVPSMWTYDMPNIQLPPDVTETPKSFVYPEEGEMERGRMVWQGMMIVDGVTLLPAPQNQQGVEMIVDPAEVSEDSLVELVQAMGVPANSFADLFQVNPQGQQGQPQGQGQGQVHGNANPNQQQQGGQQLGELNQYPLQNQGSQGTGQAQGDTMNIEYTEPLSPVRGNTQSTNQFLYRSPTRNRPKNDINIFNSVNASPNKEMEEEELSLAPETFRNLPDARVDAEAILDNFVQQYKLLVIVNTEIQNIAGRNIWNKNIVPDIERGMDLLTDAKAAIDAIEMVTTDFVRHRMNLEAELAQDRGEHANLDAKFAQWLAKHQNEVAEYEPWYEVDESQVGLYNKALAQLLPSQEVYESWSRRIVQSAASLSLNLEISDENFREYARMLWRFMQEIEKQLREIRKKIGLNSPPVEFNINNRNKKNGEDDDSSLGGSGGGGRGLINLMGGSNMMAAT